MLFTMDSAKDFFIYIRSAFGNVFSLLPLRCCWRSWLPWASPNMSTMKKIVNELNKWRDELNKIEVVLGKQAQGIGL